LIVYCELPVSKLLVINFLVTLNLDISESSEKDLIRRVISEPSNSFDEKYSNSCKFISDLILMMS
ncbi:MAG TPA: hypothetical protein VMS35_01405, partial [Nitrososphaeraceae archaeon]|nr:hypothetical protein [Nitrososphaeraceae archaeon]